MRFLITGFCFVLSSLGAFAAQDVTHTVLVSVPDQCMMILENGVPVAQYAISTSKYGVGDRCGRYTTPLGTLQVAQKIGANAPMGAVFKGRRWTGEVLRPNALGRDPIVTRILWLRGMDNGNRNAYGRGIYIHGTPEEYRIGRPASYGCIRMRSRDVVKVFNTVGVGARINIVNMPLSRVIHMVATAHGPAGFAS